MAVAQPQEMGGGQARRGPVVRADEVELRVREPLVDQDEAVERALELPQEVGVGVRPDEEHAVGAAADEQLEILPGADEVVRGDVEQDLVALAGGPLG